MHDPFFTEVARGAEDAARHDGHLMIMCSSDGNAVQERRLLEVLDEQRASGALISPVDERGEDLAWLRRRGTSIVLLGCRRRHYCSVRVDDVSGGELAAEHLLSLGHRQLAYVAATHSTRQHGDRLLGVRQTLARHDLPPTACEVVDVGPLAADGEGRAAAELLSRSPRVTGVICGNDLLALHLVAGLISLGLRVPREVSVVGYDDIQLAQQGPLPLTTIKQPKSDLGRVGATLVMEEVRRTAAHAHQQVVFQPELVVRETTAHAVEHHVAGPVLPVV